MKLSIITPVYNRQDCIARCIESVIANLCIDLEHWIIDDGSSDGTAEIINRYASQYKHIHFIQLDKNRGVGAARNAGIKASTGDYIMFLDSDDRLIDGAIDFVSTRVKEYPDFHYFLFGIDYRESYYQSADLLKNPVNIIQFNNWLAKEVNGDFVHVIDSSIMKKFLFDESICIYEYTTFLHLYKYSGKQLFSQKAIAQIEQNRKDSVSLQYKLTRTSSMKKECRALESVIVNFYDDYKKANAHGILNKNIQKFLYLALATQNYEAYDRMIYGEKNWSMRIIRNLKIGFLLKYTIMLYSGIKNR